MKSGPTVKRGWRDTTTTIGTSLLHLCVLIGLSLALALRKLLSAAAFGTLLAAAITI